MLTVYADVLVALNTVITYIFIVCTRLMCKIPTNKIAVAVASFIGGFSAVVIFFDGIGLFFSVCYKVLTACLIVSAAFLPRTPKGFFKPLLSFSAVSFLFGGAIYALEITFNPNGIYYYNGTVYFDMSLTYLVGCTFAVYGIFLLANFLIGRKMSDGGKCELKIIFRNCEVTLCALIDTGNTLTESMSGRPVCVAELSAVAPLLSFEECLFFKKGIYDDIPTDFKKRVRLVPCKYVSGESLLASFIPDKIVVKKDNYTVETDFCAIAVTNKELSAGEYRALLNNDIFENNRKEFENGVKSFEQNKNT